MTNEEISNLTDEQINVMLEGVNCVKADYCNDPAVMWPIILNDGIGIYPEKFGSSGMWTAAISKYKSHNQKHANPLRAAAIVYLKIKGVL